MSKIKISISIEDAHIERILEIARDLNSVGMEVEQTLPTVGVIGGSIEPDKIYALNQIEGVQHIEHERSYQLAPPDSEVQ